jgi:hypothetical protein
VICFSNCSPLKYTVLAVSGATTVCSWRLTAVSSPSVAYRLRDAVIPTDDRTSTASSQRSHFESISSMGGERMRKPVLAWNCSHGSACTIIVTVSCPLPVDIADEPLSGLSEWGT